MTKRNRTNLPELIKKIEDEQVFEEILQAVAERGLFFRPMNYIWELLPFSLAVKEVRIPEEITPEEVSPVLVASFLEFGQLLPVWVDREGRVIEGRKRSFFFGYSTKYLVYPRRLQEREWAEIRFTDKMGKNLLKRIAEKLGVEVWRRESGLKSGTKS